MGEEAKNKNRRAIAKGGGAGLATVDGCRATGRQAPRLAPIHMRRDAHTPSLPTPTQCRPYPPTAVADGAPDRPRTTRAAGKQGPTSPERTAMLATPGRTRPPNHPPTLPARTGGGGTKQPLHDSASRDRRRVETHTRAPKRHPPATASAPNSRAETPGGSR